MAESDPAAPAAPAAPVTPEAPAAPPPAPAAPETDPFDSPDTTTFERPYVEKLRKEAADRRTAHKPFEDAFSPYSEEERTVWLNLAKITAQDPKQGKAIMDELFAAMLEDEGPPAEVPHEGEDRPLTKKELEAWTADRERSQAEAAAVKQVETEAVSLGYKPGDHRYVALMRRALDEFDGDIGKAHSAFEADKQAVIDAFVAEQAAAGQRFPVAPGSGGTPPADPTGGQPKTFAEAKASTKARLAAQAGT